MLRRRGGAVLGVRREGARGEQARREAPESPPHLRSLAAAVAKVRYLPGYLFFLLRSSRFFIFFVIWLRGR